MVRADNGCQLPVIHYSGPTTCLLVERMEHRNRTHESFFGAPCSLIQKDNPFLQVANFTDHPATIQKGRILGWAQDPTSYLDSEHNKSEEEVTRLHAHASAIRTIVNDLLDQSNPAQSGQEEELEGEAVMTSVQSGIT